MCDWHRVCADIDLDLIKHNVKEIKENLPPKTNIMAVIKANAYGHGDVSVAKALDNQASYYAVAALGEALKLRQNGIKKPVLILGYVFPEEFEKLVKNDISATIFDYETAKKLSDEAIKQKKTVSCHIKLDTGMRRIGIEPEKESKVLLKKIKELPGLDVCGIFTHFAASDAKDKTSAELQYKKFTDFVDECGKEGINFSLKHCANSAAAIDMPYTALDIVRPGIAIYGMYPSDETDKTKVSLRQAMSLKSRIVMVKTVKPGEGISYGSTYITKKPTRVATVSIGYADGYPRSLSGKGQMIVHGRKVPVVGRVCMDQVMLDVTDIPNVQRGDIATVTGRDGDEFISVEDICKAAQGAFHYEFVCDISPRVPRRYILDGKLTDISDIC